MQSQVKSTMTNKKEEKELDTSTEEKIKEAARIVFHKKGFAATRTRDIADEAGINLSLLNYYFRSKEKLFELIMLETLGEFVKGLVMVLNDRESTLLEKVSAIAEHYIDSIKDKPEIPGFIVSEIRNNVNNILEKIPVREILAESFFVQQLDAEIKKGTLKEVSPIQFIMNVLGMVLFPFIAQPMIMSGTGLINQEFSALMEERKKLIPIWVQAMFKA